MRDVIAALCTWRPLKPAELPVDAHVIGEPATVTAILRTAPPLSSFMPRYPQSLGVWR